MCLYEYLSNLEPDPPFIGPESRVSPLGKALAAAEKTPSTLNPSRQNKAAKIGRGHDRATWHSPTVPHGTTVLRGTASPCHFAVCSILDSSSSHARVCVAWAPRADTRDFGP